MIFLSDSLAVSGISAEYETYFINQLNNCEIGNFFLNEEGTLDSLEKYLLIPLVFTSNIKFLAYRTFQLSKGIQYNISGSTAHKSGTVYISNYEENVDFTNDIIYSTEIKGNGIFNFQFTNELNFEEDTKIIVWVQGFTYSQLTRFNATLSNNIPTPDIPDSPSQPNTPSKNIVYLGAIPPIEPQNSQHILNIKGNAQYTNNQVNGVFIYEEGVLPDTALNEQAIVIEGFNKLENGENFSSDAEYDTFYKALISRTDGSTEITTDSAGTFALALKQRVNEQTFPVSYFYLWALEINEIPEGESSGIFITKTEQGVNDVTWTVCLAGETPILMADNSEKRLDEIQPGDLVRDTNGQSTKVLRVNRGSFNPYHTLYFFEGDIIIDEISTHRFYNVEKGYWEHLAKWEIGQHALDVNGVARALLRKKRIYEKKENFGLDTESGRYFANGLLSGPARCNQSILKDSTLDKVVNIACSIKDFQGMDLLDIGEIL